jgi:gas vesicle protein
MTMNYQDRGTENNSESFVGSFGTTLFIGLTIGLVAVLLLAPKAGKESRGILKEQFGSVRDKVMRMGSTNGGELQEEPIESAVRADYFH